MTKQAVFEVPTFADAISKANRVAPTKGAAFDKAAGIVIEVDPNGPDPVLVKATNIDVTIRLSVASLELGDEPATWRVPAKLLNGIVSTLPIESGSQIKLLDIDDGELYFKSGKTKAKLRQIRGDYPLIANHDIDSLTEVEGLSHRLGQVAWAVDKNSASVLGGVHMSGTDLVGCNTARLARVPCKIDLDEPITAPLHDIAAIIRNTAEVMLGTSGTRVVIAPDRYTQATSNIIEGNYANYEKLLANNCDNQMTVQSSELLATLDRTLTLAQAERNPATNVELGDGIMKIEMDVPDVGRVVDELEVEGGHGGDPVKMRFDAQSLKETINASGRPTFKFSYQEPMRPVHIEDDSHFHVVLMPMRAV